MTHHEHLSRQRAIAIIDILAACAWADDIAILLQQARAASVEGDRVALSVVADAAGALAEAVACSGVFGTPRRPEREYSVIKAVESAVCCILQAGENASLESSAHNSDEAIFARLGNAAPLYWAKRAAPEAFGVAL